MSPADFAMQTDTDSITLVFLHGFLGSRHDFDRVIKKLPEKLQKHCVSLPLPGHHNSQPADYRESVGYIRSRLIAENVTGDFILYGYATGGRIAICYAFQARDPHLKGLFVESASFGISDEERKLREGKDLMWAAQFAFKPPEEIVRAWYSQPRFSGMTDQRKETIIKKRKNQDFENLVQQFSLTSVAKMENFRDRLGELPFDVVYLYGELDEKFRLAADREKRYSNFRAYPIAGASHNIHMFHPENVAEVIAGNIPGEN